MNTKSLRYSVALFVFAVSGACTQNAFAYGIEGLFGGRPSPDAYIPTTTAVQTETRPDRAQTVLEHPRDDYDAVPIPVGSFDLYPSVEAGVTSDSNIYAQQGAGTPDQVFSLHPSLTAQSNWSRHALAFKTSGDVNFYNNNAQENYSNFVSLAEGRYDIMNRTWLLGRAGYQYIAEPRTTPNASSGAKPTTFNVYNGGASAYRGAGKLQVQGDYDFYHFVYNNPPSATGTINESSRDRDQHNIGGKFAYEVSQDFNPYIKLQYNKRNYATNTARTSDGYRADGGVQWDLGGITSLDAYAGWLSQTYSNFTADNQTNGNFDFGARITWNVTSLTTVVLETSRSIEETTLSTYNSFTSSGGSATVTHELLRNVLIEADGSTQYNDFNGTGSREDKIMSAGLGTRYLINRNLYSDLGYNWSHRVSTDSDQGYVKHVITFRVGAQF